MPGWWATVEVGPFDRTYEGLKPLPGGAGEPGRPPFDRTYEGLKPGRPGGGPLPVVPLLTVPMRV